MVPFDVSERLAQLREHSPRLHLYALIDGAQWLAQHGEPLAPTASHQALFSHTPDAPLAHAGPWLVDAERADASFVDALVCWEQRAPAVSWLIAVADLPGLAQLLQLQLDMRLPDGRTALLRFWDPRVLVSLIEVLEPAQADAFFAHIHEWHLLHHGRRVWIGRPDAHAR